jgi:hypothetical protein
MFELLRRFLFFAGPFLLLIFGTFGFPSIASLVLFISVILYIVLEVYVLISENKNINYAKGIMKVLFFGKSPDNIFWKESLITSKGARKFWRWAALVFCVVGFIWYIVFVLVLKLLPPYFV